MKLKTLAHALVLTSVTMGLSAAPGFAKHCQDVGGGVLTNFLDATHTEGTVTGDFRGAIGVAVTGVTSGPNGTTIYHVQHHWVTDAGDTIDLKDAYLSTFPTSDPNRVVADYLKGVDLIGGTGRFDGATGSLSSVFGAVDLNKGQLTLRFEGIFCFPTVEAP
jgi:hypothetical protein